MKEASVLKCETVMAALVGTIQPKLVHILDQAQHVAGRQTLEGARLYRFSSGAHRDLFQMLSLLQMSLENVAGVNYVQALSFS